jgi:hypothetical protein
MQAKLCMAQQQCSSCTLLSQRYCCTAVLLQALTNLIGVLLLLGGAAAM